MWCGVGIGVRVVEAEVEVDVEVDRVLAWMVPYCVVPCVGFLPRWGICSGNLCVRVEDQMKFDMILYPSSKSTMRPPRSALEPCSQTLRQPKPGQLATLVQGWATSKRVKADSRQ